MHVMDAIKERTSIRNYSPQPIEEEKILQILEAGRLSPSARNRQERIFVVVKDNTLIQKLVAPCCDQDFVGQAPVVLLICTEKNQLMTCGQPDGTIDCSIALSFMMLAATELGLGTCWLGSFHPEEVKKVLSLPDSYEVIAVTPLGYPAKPTSPRPRKMLREMVKEL